jgi:hypothetical protein
MIVMDVQVNWTYKTLNLVMVWINCDTKKVQCNGKWVINQYYKGVNCCKPVIARA